MGDGSPTAWLDRPDLDPVPVTGNCSLGRTLGNDVVLVDDRVSRRHATIHAQGEKEFLLVDLGSRNGTFLNGRRINQPTHLHDGDQVQVGPFTLVFRQPAPEAAGSQRPRQEPQTMVDMQSTPCWLLLCDITGSSVLAREKTASELAVLIGSWFGRCKEVIEDNGGVINKYLGDGLLAYWRAREELLPHVAQAVRELAQIQQAEQPRFRIVLHHGLVTIGGMLSGGEDSLAGPEVNLVFRLERLASELKIIRLASGKAVHALGTRLPASPAGEHAVQGFEVKIPVFSF